MIIFHWNWRKLQISSEEVSKLAGDIKNKLKIS